MRTRTHFICIGMHFDYVCHLTITNNGFHKGGRAAFGGPPTFVEAAEGRLHYGAWGGGRHSKNISKCAFI